MFSIGAGPNNTAVVTVSERPGLYACALQIKQAFPDIKIGALSGTSECWNPSCQVRWVANDPKAWQQSVAQYLAQHPWVDELWTDWEVPLCGTGGGCVPFP